MLNRKQPKYTQRDKQRRGAEFEKEFRNSLPYFNLWGHKLECDGYNPQPFDFILTTKGGACGVELKCTQSFMLPYSAIRGSKSKGKKSQREGLTEFESKISTNKSFILVRVLNDTTDKIYVVPWAKVKDDVCGPKRGSIDLLDYPSAPIPWIHIGNKRVINLRFFEEVHNEV